MQRHRRVRIITSKILPHRKGDPPIGPSTSRPRATPRRSSGPLASRRRSRLGVSRLASSWTGTPAIRSPITRGRGATTSQRPCRQGLNSVARLRHERRLGARDGPTWRWLWGSVGVGAAWRRLPLLTPTRPSWRPLWDSRPWGVDAGLRRALEDPVETGCYPLRVVTVVVIAAIILVGGFFLRLPPLPRLCSTRL